MILRLIGVLAGLIISLGSLAQSFEGKEFWFSYLPNYQGASGGDLRQQMHIISKNDTKAYISIPLGGVPFLDSIDVVANQVTTYDFPDLNRTYSNISETVVGKAVNVFSADSILIYLGAYKQFSTDVAIALPTDACGDEYHVVSMMDDRSGVGSGMNLTQFVVVGQEDNTNVSIEVMGFTRNGAETGDILSFSLNKGESYTVLSEDHPNVPFGDLNDLTGSRVYTTNGKDVAVYVGNNCANVGGCGNCDMLFEQVRPANTLGKEFFLARTKKSVILEDYVRVFAVDDGTIYNINGNPQPVLNKNEFRDFNLNNGMHILSNNPIQVTQFLKGHKCYSGNPKPETDPLMIDILPKELNSPSYTFGTSSFNRFNAHYCTVIAEASDIPNLRMNGAPVTLLDVGVIPGTTREYGFLDLSVGTSYTMGSITGQSFSLYVYGYGERETYGYAAGGQLINLDLCPEVDFSFMDGGTTFDKDFTDLSDPGEFDIVHWNWSFGDNATADIFPPNNGDTQHTYANPGYYTVTLTATNDALPEECSESVSKTVKVGEVDPCLIAGYYLDSNLFDFGPSQLHGNINSDVSYVEGVDGDNFAAIHLNGNQLINAGTISNFESFDQTSFGFNLYYKADEVDYPSNTKQDLVELIDDNKNWAATVVLQKISNGEVFVQFEQTLQSESWVLQTRFDEVLDGRWHCIKVEIENSLEKSGVIFIDGVQMETTVSGGNVAVVNALSPRLFIGAGGANQDFVTGSLDEIRVSGCPPALTCEKGTPNQFFIYPDFEFISCGEQSTITGDVIGGVAPFSFELVGEETNTEFVFDSVPPATYTIIATDASGAVRTKTITVGPPEIVVDDINVFEAGCDGDSGAIYIDHCGYAPYTYYLNGTQIVGPYFDGLAPGNHLIKIVDNKGYELDTVVFVDYEPKVTAVTVKQLNCEGSIDGRIQVMVSCDDPEIRYQLNGGTLQISGIFPNLEAGTYELKVWNGYNQVFYTETIELIEGDPVEVEDYSFLNPTCNGINNGAIEIIHPNKPGLLYSINGGDNFSSERSYTDLPAGDYELMVLDPVGCVSAKVPVTLENIQEVVITNAEVVRQPSCAPNADGKILVEAAGGFGTYSFGRDNLGYSTSDTLKNVPGDVTVAVFAKDYLGCLSDTVDVAVAYAGKLGIALADILDASCGDEQDGEVRVVIDSDVQDPKLNYFDGLGYQTRPLHRTDLAAGFYAVALQDANGCLSDTLYFDIDNTGKLRAPNIVVRPINCDPPTLGATSGAVAVFPDSIPGSNYDYSFDGRDFVLPNDTFDLSLGDQVTVVVRRPEDGPKEECFSDPITVEVGEAIALDTINLNIVGETCYLFYDGSLEVEAIGGGGNYTYELYTGYPAGVLERSEQETGVFPNLSASLNHFKTLRVYTDDVCGLTDQRVYKDFMIDMGAIGPLTLIQYIREPITCEDFSDGEIEMIITGGVPDFEFTIDGGQNWGSASVVTGLATGPYNLQVRDGRGCYTPIYNTELLNPDPVQIDDIVVSSVNCYGDSTGTIEIVGFGGSEEYLYSIDGGTTFQQERKFYDLASGTYEIVFEDKEGCGTIAATVFVDQSDSLELYASKDNPFTCVPGDEGAVFLFPQGGTEPYVFRDEQGNIFHDDVVGNLSAGEYTFKLTDNYGCAAEPLTVELSERDISGAYQVDILQQVSCFGEDDGVIRVSIDSDDAQYSLDVGNSWITNGLFSNISAGTYDLRVQAWGCEASELIEMVEPEEVLITVTQEDPILCHGDRTRLIVEGSNGSSPYEVSTNGGLSFSTNNVFDNVGAGGYDFIVMDADGCESKEITYSIAEPDPVDFDVTIYPTVEGGDGIIAFDASGGTPPYRYSIETDVYQIDDVFMNVDKGVYTITVQDANGCEKSEEVEVQHISGIGDVNSLAAAVMLFPNPTTGIVNIKATLPIEKVMVYNMLGQELLSSTSTSLDLKFLHEGVFLVRVELAGGKVSQQRIVLEQ